MGKPNNNASNRLEDDLSVRFSGNSKDALQDEEEMCKISSSKTSMKNTERARKVVTEFALKIGVEDPKVVTPESSKLVMNLLYSYCYTGTPKALSDDTMGGLVQGIRNIYTENGHWGPWRVDIKDGTASGNPLNANEDIKRLRATHRVYLAQIGRARRRARPLLMAQVCEHAQRFWFGCGTPIDYRDVLLHTIMIVGLNLGLRYDEAHKLRIENVSVIPGQTGTGSILLNIPTTIKNSTKGREYIPREWPGNTQMRHSILVDPFTAHISWMWVRGNREGFLFCDVSEKNIIITSKPWSVHDFTKFMRLRLRHCGVGQGSVPLYSGHSLKRGAVQLYRSLGIRDEQIIQMVGANGKLLCGIQRLSPNGFAKVLKRTGLS